MNITLTLHLDEVQSILNIVGQLPTSSGAFPLLCKIKEQADAAVIAANAAISEGKNGTDPQLLKD